MFRIRRSKPTPARAGVIRELDRRVADGLEVTLDWDQANGDVWLGVHDRRAQTYICQTIRPELALHAFHHPFAYVPVAA